MALRRILGLMSVGVTLASRVSAWFARANHAESSREAHRGLWRAVVVVVAISSLLSIVSPAMTTADVPMYDNVGNDMRFIESHSAAQIYLNVPLYIELPQGQQSSSMPTISGDTVYQYTWDSSGHGHLYAINLPNVGYSHMLQEQGSTHYALTQAIYAQPPITFNAGFTSDGFNAADGKDSLSTGPYVNGASYGSKYEAIAVGRYLYTWVAGSYPQGGLPPTTVRFIRGNPTDTDYRVDEHPLITPPVTVAGLDASGNQTTWSSPVAVVGSRDGGLVAWPTYVPPGYSPHSEHYSTSQDYAHSVAAMTSTPTWVGACSVGSACVAFGIAGVHPRVILFNVTTSHWKVIGAGLIAAPVTNPVLYDSTGSNNLIVQDEYGDIYSFSLSGQLLGTYFGGIPGGGTDALWVNNHEPISGKDMSVLTDATGQTLWAIGGGGALFNALNPTTLKPLLDPTSEFGPGVNSPTSMVDITGSPTMVVSNAKGDIYLYGTGAIFTGTGGGTYFQASSTPPGTPDVGFAPDGGASHWLIGWTNSDPRGLPAIVAFVPETYTVVAAIAQTDVPSGSRVTITARPFPVGVTYNEGFNNNGPSGKYPVEVQIENAQGQALGVVIPLHRRGAGVTDWWSGDWAPPPNKTGSPMTYKAIVIAWSETDVKAQSRPVSFTVEAPAPLPPRQRRRPTWDRYLPQQYRRLRGGSAQIRPCGPRSTAQERRDSRPPTALDCVQTGYAVEPGAGGSAQGRAITWSGLTSAATFSSNTTPAHLYLPSRCGRSLRDFRSSRACLSRAGGQA